MIETEEHADRAHELSIISDNGEPEENSEVDPYEDPKEDPEEDVEEEIEEQVEVDSEMEPGEEAEEDSSEDLSEVQEEEETDYDTSEDDKEHGHSEEYMPNQSCVAENEPAVSSVAKNEENPVIPRKRSFSRWEPQPQRHVTSQRRKKTRWDRDKPGIETVSHLRSTELVFDPEVVKLKIRLLQINTKLKSSKVFDDRPKEERSPSPEPVYNNLGIRLNTREVRLRRKLTQERDEIKSILNGKKRTAENPTVSKPKKYSKRLYVPVKEYPNYNFIGLILGPRGNTQKEMEKATGAKIFLRGKGSVRDPQKSDLFCEKDLHVLIEARRKKSLDAAVAMVQKILVPKDDQLNDLKQSQLKELAELKGNKLDENLCHVCLERGHKAYACPQRSSTLKEIITCDVCQSISHPTTNCPKNYVINSGPTSRLTVKPSKEIDDSNLYIANLPPDVTEGWLREMFSPFGKIASSTVIKDKSTGLSKGYGFVKFENSMDAAIAMMHVSNYQMDGRWLTIRVAGVPPSTVSAAPPVAFSAVPGFAPLPVAYSQQGPVYPAAMNQGAWAGRPASSMAVGALPSVLISGGLGLVPTLTYPTAHGDCFPTADASSSSTQGAIAQFPGDPDYSSSKSFPGDPDYPGSEFKMYFSSNSAF